MASDGLDREVILRAKLVQRVSASSTRPRLASPQRPERLTAAIVTAVVLIVVVAASLTALRLTNGSATPAVVGSSSTAVSKLASNDAAPTPSLPAGPVLGRYSSKDGPNQDHTIKPDGLALATLFTCTGKGRYSTSIAHSGEEAGDGRCDGGGLSSGNKGVAGSTTVRIRTDRDMSWTFTIIGIPETYVTPRPIPTPTDATGADVAYCTSTDLTARFQHVAETGDAAGVNAGELVFTNKSASTCALAGYPEVRFLSGGSPLGHNTMNHGDPRDSTKDGLRAVVVKPGTSAYSQIDWYRAGENAAEEGKCVERQVSSVQIDLHYDLAAPSQTGTLDVPIGHTIACLNGQHGALGKYGQISSTVFVDYTLAKNH